MVAVAVLFYYPTLLIKQCFWKGVDFHRVNGAAADLASIQTSIVACGCVSLVRIQQNLGLRQAIVCRRFEMFQKVALEKQYPHLFCDGCAGGRW